MELCSLTFRHAKQALILYRKNIEWKNIKSQVVSPFQPCVYAIPDTLPPLKKFLKNFEKYKGTDKNGFLQQKIPTINRKDI